MSFCLVNGRPSIRCDKCANRITVTETLIVKWADLETVITLCEPCVQALEESWSVKEDSTRFETMPALRYFQMFLGRTTQAVQPNNKPAPVVPAASWRRFVSPPTFKPEDVR